MRFENEACGIITEARNVLIRRRRQTSDPQERAAIDATIIMLNEQLGLLNQAALDVAAELVVEATEALGGVVASARLGPFDDFVVALGKVLHQTAALLRDGDMGEHLEQAPDAEAASPMTTASGSEVAPPTRAGPEPVATASSSPPAVISAPLPPVGSGRDFASLRSSMRPGFRPWLCGPSLTAKWTGMWNSC